MCDNRIPRYGVAYGVVLSEKMYNDYGSKLRNAILFNTRNEDAVARERMFFSLGKNRMYVVCKDNGNRIIYDYLEAGLLVDMTKITDVTSVDQLHNVIMVNINSEQEYIFQCNRIRETIAQLSDRGFRWNGSEWESLTSRSIMLRAGIINGKFDSGIFWDQEGNFVNKPPRLGYNFAVLESFSRAKTLSDGQAKLYTVMFGFAMTRNIIYIGSAPGEGWLKALDFDRRDITVYSFDPESLYDDPIDETLQRDSAYRVVHHRIMVRGPDDVWAHVPPGLYDFIWDVRGDTSGVYDAAANEDEARRAVASMILEEIGIFNSIVADIRWGNVVRCSLKVHVSLLGEYVLPDRFRFYMMPFSIRSGHLLCEVRCVFKNSKNNSIYVTKKNICTSLIRCQMNAVVQDLGDSFDEIMFVNSLLMRFDYQDFTDDVDDGLVSSDVSLFCINWNDPGKVASYVRSMISLKRPFLCSYFCGSHLVEGEHRIDESEMLRMGLYFYDSRTFINRKLNDLYFMSNHGSIKYYRHELTSGETYYIMDEEMRMRDLGLIQKYDQVRDVVCSENGHVFYKFPNSFSIVENVISPSGHAARMISKYLREEVSLGMFIRKIQYSFYSFKSKWIETSHLCKETGKICGIEPLVSKGPGERREVRLWHSYIEWVMGIRAGYALSRRVDYDRILDYMAFSIVAKDKIGVEMRTFYQNIKVDRDKLNAQITRAISGDDPDPEVHRERMLESSKNVPITWNALELIVSPLSNSRWLAYIHHFRVDKILRGLLIHKAFFEVVSRGAFPNHDRTLTSLFSLTAIGCYRMTGDVSYLARMTDLPPFRFPEIININIDRLPNNDELDESIFGILADTWIESFTFERDILSDVLLAKVVCPFKSSEVRVAFGLRICKIFPVGRRLSVRSVLKRLREITPLIH